MSQAGENCYSDPYGVFNNGVYSVALSSSLVCGAVIGLSADGRFVDGWSFIFCDGTNSTYVGKGTSQLVFLTDRTDPIVQVTIRSGLWIDNIKFTTRSGRLSSAEGYGGEGGYGYKADVSKGFLGAEQVVGMRDGAIMGLKIVTKCGPVQDPAVLTSGRRLRAGESIWNVKNGYHIDQQFDGELAFKDNSDNTLFVFGTSGYPGAWADLEPYCNVLAYRIDPDTGYLRLVQKRSIGPNYYCSVVVSDAGKMVIYDSDGKINGMVPP